MYPIQESDFYHKIYQITCANMKITYREMENAVNYGLHTGALVICIEARPLPVGGDVEFRE